MSIVLSRSCVLRSPFNLVIWSPNVQQAGKVCVCEWTDWPFHVSMAAANEASWGCYDIKAVCDRCSWVVLSLSLCVCPTRGSFTILNCGELNDTPHHPTRTAPLSTLHGFPLLPPLSWLRLVTPLTGGSDSWASVTFWARHELQPRGSDGGNEAGWQLLKYGCCFVCCDIWRQPGSPRYTALVALYSSA